VPLVLLFYADLLEDKSVVPPLKRVKKGRKRLKRIRSRGESSSPPNSTTHTSTNSGTTSDLHESGGERSQVGVQVPPAILASDFATVVSLHGDGVAAANEWHPLFLETEERDDIITASDMVDSLDDARGNDEEVEEGSSAAVVRDQRASTMANTDTETDRANAGVQPGRKRSNQYKCGRCSALGHTKRSRKCPVRIQANV
jgi:hypothetical protein